MPVTIAAYFSRRLELMKIKTTNINTNEMINSATNADSELCGGIGLVTPKLTNGCANQSPSANFKVKAAAIAPANCASV